jgi:predicted nucleic acid-binding protein
MLDELGDLSRLRAMEISDLNNSVLQNSIGNVIKHHICIADALQITTAKEENTDIFVSADRRLTEASEKEKLKLNLLES